MYILDELQRKLTIQKTPQRIISLCPAITETLFALGVGERVVGRTKFCIFPEAAATVEIVGGTKQINEEKIRALQPDIIFAEKEENTKEIVEALEQQFVVYVAQVESIEHAYTMIEKVGRVVQAEAEATVLVARIKASTLPTMTGRAAYMMWRKPYMVVGATTYINDVLETIGFTNPFTAMDGRYPSVTIEQLQQAKLDYLFLSSEPFPFQQKHIDELQQHLPRTRIQLIDGEMFWYGAKMAEAATYLQAYFNK